MWVAINLDDRRRPNAELDSLHYLWLNFTRKLMIILSNRDGYFPQRGQTQEERVESHVTDIPIIRIGFRGKEFYCP